MKEIDTLIAAKILKIQKLEQGLVEARAELRGLQSARDALGGRNGGSPIKAVKTTPATGGRGLSDTWQRILCFIGTEGRSIDEIVGFVEQAGLEITRNTIRSQAHVMVSKTELLERLDQGRFRLTQKGIESSGYKNEAPSVGADGASDSINPLVTSEHTRSDVPGDEEL